MPTYDDFVVQISKLSSSDFLLLQQVVAERKNREKYGFVTLDEAASVYGRQMICPACGSVACHEDGKTPSGRQRYQCNDCGELFSNMTNSVFNSTKKDFDTWMKYVSLMIHYPSLELAEDICEISHPTAFLWRHKIFATVDGYQEHLILKDRVWIDETHIEDSIIRNSSGYQKKRSLSKNMVCIVVAIDRYKNMIAFVCDHGKLSSKRIIDALKDHIKPGSVMFMMVTTHIRS